MSNHNEAHSSLVHEIRIRLAGPGSDLVLWQNQTGVAKFEGGSRVRYGLAKGSADLIGVLRPGGRFVALEIKTGTGTETDEQLLFLALVRNCGGFAAVVRSLDEAKEALQRAREGLSA